MNAPTEFTAYINGEFVPDSAAHISIHDRGFFWGDGALDTIRTFNGEPFQTPEHVERLYQVCDYLRLDPGLTQEEFIYAVDEVARRSHPLLEDGHDLWVLMHVTRGVNRPGYRPGATVAIGARPLPLKERAPYYRDGIPVVVASSVRRTPPWAVSPRMKTHNFINLIVAELEVNAYAPGAWALLLDEHGNICEGTGSNFFAVKDETLLTPKLDYVLNGISRRNVIKLAADLGLPVRECDIHMQHAYAADELFLTSTSLCICGVSTLNGRPVGTGEQPGPVTARLLEAYSEMASFDIRGHHLANLDPSVSASSGWALSR